VQQQLMHLLNSRGRLALYEHFDFGQPSTGATVFPQERNGRNTAFCSGQ